MPTAAILVGGRATRLGGQPKGSLIVEGRPILARQLDELSRLTEDILLVGGPADTEAPPARAVPDRTPGRGPLGGLDAALAAARDDVVMVVACDMPFVSAEFLEHLLTLVHNADAVVPRTARGYHPLCAIYTRRCQPAVERRLTESRLAMLGLLDDVRVRVFECGEVPAFDCDRLLTNVNTPGDLAELDAQQDHEP